MRGWTNSNSTKRLERVYAAIESERAAVNEWGRQAMAEPTAPGSFYVKPVEAPALAEMGDGVPVALRRHLTEQGLDGLAAVVPKLESIGRAVRDRGPADHTVSDVVYQMH